MHVCTSNTQESDVSPLSVSRVVDINKPSLCFRSISTFPLRNGFRLHHTNLSSLPLLPRSHASLDTPKMASFSRAITALGRRGVFSPFASRCSAVRKTQAEANPRFSTIRYQPHSSGLNGFSTDAALEPIDLSPDTGKAAADPGKGDEINHREKFMKMLAEGLSPDLLVKLMELHLDERTAMEFFCWAGRQTRLNIHEQTISRVARSWTSVAKVDKLASLLEEYKREGGQTYEPAWALMMRIKTYSNNASEVVRTFSDMKESGCEPSVLTYNILLRAFLMNEQFDDAVATWREMLGIGLILNDFTVSIICFLLGRFVEPKEAVKFLSEMVKWDQITKHSRRINKLLRTLASTANSNEVQELFTELVSAGFVPNEQSYATLVASLYLGGKVEEAKKQLEELTKMAASSESAFLTIILRLSEAEKWEEIIDIVEVAKEHGCISNSFFHTQRIKALFATGRTHDAEEASNEMSKAGCTWDVETYAVMTQHYCKEGMVDRALELRNEMYETGCKADVDFFQVLADGLCNANRIQEAIDLLSDMRGKGCPPNAIVYRIIVSHISKLEDNTTAYELLTKMIEAERGKRHHITLMQVLCELGRFQEAEELYFKLSQKSHDARLKCFGILVTALCRARKLDKLLDMIKRTRKWQHPVVCTELIKILFEQERLHDGCPTGCLKVVI